MNLQGETILQRTEAASVKAVKMLASPPLPRGLSGLGGQIRFLFIFVARGPRWH